ncbi:hypothetical protein LshimejAT787_2200700 [Lyophyllum shimeji]|uniref:Uncharacterized protein n=1 Tax=Lyophyllum shimeji TaxID=47721 RepID=A0A9P3Q240_LYOSH|nr:hypothetical protein LshimejAT787_2200700 [Lyophyllum shimeji]
MMHYVESIQALGSADGYNTESPERLHIDFAKDAYRASNKRDYVEQMTLWLQRREAMWMREVFCMWVNDGLAAEPEVEDEGDNDGDDKESESDTEPERHQLLFLTLTPFLLPHLWSPATSSQRSLLSRTLALTVFVPTSVPLTSFLR